MRKLTILVMTMLLIAVAIMPAQAAVLPEGEISPMAQYHHEAKASLSISSGYAEAKGQITGWIGTTTKCSITLYLQRYENGDWEDVAMWTDTANSSSLTLTRTLGVDSGYKYRAKAICYAYSGSQMEYVTRYSSEVRY